MILRMDKDNPPSTPMTNKLAAMNGYRSVFEGVIGKLLFVMIPPQIAEKVVDKTIYERPKELSAIFHKAFSAYYTADEILELIAFYRSPIGMKLVERDEAVRTILRDEILRLSTQIAMDIVINVRKDQGDQSYDPDKLGGFL